MLFVRAFLPRSPRRFSIFNRAMSQSSATINRFFVYAPDKKEVGTHAKRYAVRPQHLTEIQPRIDSGVVQVGGLVVSSDQTEAAKGQKQAEGSLLIIKAETIDQARALVEGDVYYTSGVWDAERITILPFIPATPFP